MAVLLKLKVVQNQSDMMRMRFKHCQTLLFHIFNYFHTFQIHFNIGSNSFIMFHQSCPTPHPESVAAVVQEEYIAVGHR